MNNVYDQAHLLARAIKDSEEYKTYECAKEKVFENEKNKEMVENFREKIYKLQMQELSGEEISEEEIGKIGKLEEVLMLNPMIKEFFTAEVRFSQLIKDVNNIMEEAIDVDKD